MIVSIDAWKDFDKIEHSGIILKPQENKTEG